METGEQVGEEGGTNVTNSLLYEIKRHEII